MATTIDNSDPALRAAAKLLEKYDIGTFSKFCDDPTEFDGAKAKDVAALIMKCYEVETNWKAIAHALFHDVRLAMEHMKMRDGSSGIFYDAITEKRRHWKERFADSLELFPGVTVDREIMHAYDLPKRERDKFFKDREKAADLKRAAQKGDAK